MSVLVHLRYIYNYFVHGCAGQLLFPSWYVSALKTFSLAFEVVVHPD
jgi:hypothetical protein